MDIGIDLGTANTLVYLRDEGIKVREPSVVAVKTGTTEVVAVGDDAKRMLGRTPDTITAIRPLRDGVIADFEITEAMLKHFIKKARTKEKGNGEKLIRASKIRVVVAVPSGITEVEKRAVKDSAKQAGADEVYLIEEPMAAAIGVGLPIQDASGNMIVDIGGGTTEVAVISLSGIVQSRSLRVGGDKLDESIIAYMKRKYNLMIGESTAEMVKIKIGSATVVDQETTMDVKGRGLVDGLPKTIEVSSKEIREAMAEPLAAILSSIKEALERCPPELAADLVDRGIMLAGGGALLGGLDVWLTEQTGVPTHLSGDPLIAVVEGTGRVLSEVSYIKKMTSAGV